MVAVADITILDNDGSVSRTGSPNAAVGTGPYSFASDDFVLSGTAGALQLWDYSINGAFAVRVTFDPTTGALNTIADGSSTSPINALLSGQDFHPSFTVIANSGEETTTTFDIIGADDTASILATEGGDVIVDSALTATGTITVTDPDTNQNHALNETQFGMYGTFVVTNGEWTYTLDNELAQSLFEGEAVVDFFTVSSEDTSASQSVTINITGTNDAPVITSVSQQDTVVETNAALTASGLVTATDVDNGAILTFSKGTSTVTATGITLTQPQIDAIIGALGVAPGGSWEFSLPSPDYLNVGDSVILTTQVVVTDEFGAEAFQNVTITIQGTNDAPTLANSAAVISEDVIVNAVAGGLAADVDTGAILTFSMVGTAPGITLSNAGVFAIDTTHAAYQSLAQGASQDVTVNFKVTDENGADSPIRQVVFTVNGVNDMATIAAPNGGALSTDENNAAPIGGVATVTDVDTGQALLMATSGTTTHGSYTVAANGTYSFTLNTASVQQLNDGQSVVDTFTLTSLDGTGTQIISVTINGVDEIFTGDNGNNFFSGTAYDDQFIGAGGFDTVDYSETSGPIAIVNEGVETDGTIDGPNGHDTFTSIENFVLTSGADHFIGNGSDETVHGGNGADDIETNGGNDKVFADGGDDIVHGGSGAGDDYYDGGAGTGDTLVYSSTTLGVTVDMNLVDRSANAAVSAILTGVPLPNTTHVGLATGAEIGTDAFVGFENVTGGSGNDHLTGDDSNNVLDGGDGDDLLDGRDGDDTLIGGLGVDTVDYSHQTGAVQVNLSDGNVNAGAQGGNDTVSGIENAILTGANDQFIGDGNSNQVTGGLGNDQLDGAGGDDTAVFVNTAAVDGLATEVDVVGLHALVLGTLSGDGLDTIQNIEHLLFTNGPGTADDVTIDIVNANAVVATVNDAVGLGESPLTGPLTTAGGNVLANDINLDAAVDDVKVVTNFGSGFSETSASAGGTVQGQYGSLTINADGSYTYTAFASTNALQDGETVHDIFFYNADDGDDGTSNTAVLTININGSNDAATVGPDATAALTEDVDVTVSSETTPPGYLTASGTLTVTDPDHDESFFQSSTQFSEAGTFGIFHVEPDGSWIYNAYDSSRAIQELGVGQTLVETFNATSLDGTASNTVTITITGTNDAPLISNLLSDSNVTEIVNDSLESAISVDGLFTLAANPEIDSSTTRPHVSIEGHGGGHADFFSFTVEAGATGVFDIDHTLGFGGNDTIITIFDANGDVVASNDDPDVSNDPGSENDPGGLNSSLTHLFVTGGTYYVRVESFSDGFITSGDQYQLHISLDGGIAATALEETNAALTTTGQLYISDVDLNDTPQAAYDPLTGLTASVANGPALTAPQALALANAFSINPDGSWSLNAASPDYLGADDVLTLTYAVTVTDDHGASVPTSVTVVINGNNDGPVITSAAQTATLTESAEPAQLALHAQGVVTASDVDNGDVLSFNLNETSLSVTGTTLTGPQAAQLLNGFHLNADGTWAYDTTSPDFLPAGSVVTLTYPVDVSDGNGGFTSQNVVITINGTNDNPDILAASGGLVDAVPATGPGVLVKPQGAGDINPATAISLNGLFGLQANPNVTNATTVPHVSIQATANGHADYYSFHVGGNGGIVTLDTDLVNLLGSSDSTVGLFRSDGTFIAGNDDFAPDGGSALNSYLTVTVPPGDYYVVVDQFPGVGNPAHIISSLPVGGTYQLQVSVAPSGVETYNPSLTETNDTLATSGKVNFSDVDNADTTSASYTAATDASVTATGVTLDAGQIAAIKAGFTLVDAAGNYTYSLASPDYLAAGDTVTATFNVHVQDNHGGETIQPVTITITGTNDAPVLTGGSLDAIVDTAANTVYADVTGTIAAAATDVDNHDTKSFSLTTPAATPYGTLTLNADGTYSFAVNSAAVNALQLGTNPLLTFGVQVTDSGGLTSTANFTIQITGANDDPIATPILVSTDDNQTSVAFNLLTGAFDPDNTDVDVSATPSVTVAGVAGSLTPTEVASITAALTGGGLTVDLETGAASFDPRLFNTLDLGQTATVTLGYDVIDSNGGTIHNTTTITINGALEIVGPLTENDDGPINGGNFGDLIDGLGGDDVLNGGAGDDHIIGGLGDDRITGGAGSDLLEGNEGDDTLSGGSGDDTIVGGEGNDSIDAGSGNDTIHAGTGNNTVDGGSGIDTLVLDENLSTYTIVHSGTNYTITDANGNVTTARNIENLVGNAAPVMTNVVGGIFETPDGAMFAPFSMFSLVPFASDLEGDDITFEIIGGNEAGFFSIGELGNLVQEAPIDFETDPHSIPLTIRVSDNHGGSSTATVTINVADLNDPMGEVSIIPSTTIAEGSATGTLVATATAIDPDAGDTITYSFGESGDQGGRFAINASTGVITVADGSLLDFEAFVETTPSYVLDVVATSSGGGSSTATVTVNLSNVVEPIGPLQFEVGSPNEGYGFGGMPIGGVYAQAGEAGVTVTYTLTNDAGGRFSLSGSTLYVANALLLDFEAAPTHTVHVVATGSDGSTSEADIIINVADVENEELFGDATNNSFLGGAFADEFSGAAGDDTLSGGGGADFIVGGEGSDTLSGGDGIDTVSYFTGGVDGAVYVDLNAGFALETAVQSGTVSPTDAIISTDSLFGFENVDGTAYGDRIYGDGANNILSGLGGDDFIYAGEGDDFVTGGAGNDIMIGEGGIDMVSYSNAAGAIFGALGEGGTGFDLINETALTVGTVLGGTAAVTVDAVIGFENITGSAFGDRFYGNSGANTLDGGDGNDILYGLDGDDVLIGGNGNDRLVGGVGADTMTGGAGNDRFYLSTGLEAGYDTITDFSAGQDQLWLMRGAFGITGTDPLNLVIDGPAVDPNSFIYNSATGQLLFDADGAGAGVAVVVAQLDSGLPLTPADVILYG